MLTLKYNNHGLSTDKFKQLTISTPHSDVASAMVTLYVSEAVDSPGLARDLVHLGGVETNV